MSLAARLMRLPVAVIGVYGAAKVLQLAVAVVVARAMGKDAAGAAFYLIGLVAFNQVVAGLGLDSFAAYVYPRMKRAAALHRMRPYMNLALLVAVPVGALVSLPIFFEQPGRPVAESLFLLGVVIACTVGSVFRRLARTAFLGAGQRLRGIQHESAVNSAILIALLLLVPVRDSWTLGSILLASHVGAAAWTWADLRRTLPKAPAGTKRRWLPRRAVTRVLLLMALPSLISQGASQLLNRADVLILAPLASAAAVADYSVAIRVTFFLQAIIELTNFIYGPRILAAGNAEPAARTRLARRILAQTAVLALAVSLPILLAPGPILGLLFGPGYADAAPVLRLLTIGKLMTAPFGPLIALFVVLGHNRRLAWIISAAAGINIAVDLALILSLGALGAAIGSCTALAMMGAGYSMLFWTAFERKGRSA